jgi:alpha-D-ribose 1-methylphosphonate 5-triphosphate synthase subunit PhnG
MSTMLKEVYDALKEAGASEEKASAAAIAVSAYQLNRSNLATKEDIARLEKVTKEDIARIEREIAAAKFDILKWVVGLALAQLALLVGILVKLL